jgi:DNA replication protein DnaC
VLFTTAGHMLGELAALDSDSTLRRRLRHYARPRLLVIDLCADGSYVESSTTGAYFARRLARRASDNST